MKRNAITIAVFFLTMLTVGQVQAGLITFENITANSEFSASAGEAQLYAEVALSPSDPNLLQFSFFNAGPVASSIKSVYFDDELGLLDDIVGTTGAGVGFSADTRPATLPGGHPVGFTADFSLGADSPAPVSGVNPGDVLYVFFSLEREVTLADVLSAVESDDLRLGLHVIAFPNQQSEAFVSALTAPGPPPQQVSEPGVLALMGLGLAGLAAYRRRNRR